MQQVESSERNKYTNMPIGELYNLVLSDQKLLEELTSEQIMEIQKHINMYGTIITGEQSYINVSVINYREEAMKRQLITALIGYLYRLAFEYRPIECDSIELKYEKLIKAESTNSERVQALIRERDEKLDEYIKTSRAVVGNFLDRNFNFNPDRHVRTAHTENKKDPERKPKQDLVREMCKVAKRAPSIKKKIADSPEKMLKYISNQTLNTYSNATQASEIVGSIISVLGNPGMDYSDKLTTLNKRQKTLNGIIQDMKRVAEPLSAAESINMVKVNPPVDVFHHFGRYITNNYEHLRNVCASLYAEKPDVEFAVIYYDHFKTEDDARKYRIKHQNDFRAAPYTISNNGITLLGPFKENRERVDFYNKNTEILKIMMEQMEMDHKLGKDLMEKSVKREKVKNMMQTGLDNEGLSKYVAVANEIRGLGAKEILSKEEKERLFELQRQREQAEVPENMICMDVFKTEETADGESRLVRDVLHTQAEEPLYLDENSPYREGYQPNKIVGKKPKYVRKILKSKFGETREVNVKSDASS